MANYNNSVPLGEAGTGSAYLLPNSNAINQAYNYIDQQAEQQQQVQQQKQLAAQQLAASWQKNHLAIKGGTLFQPEINKRAQQVMDMGVELQKAGINPNLISSDPQKQDLLDKYNQQKTSLLRDVDLRDQLTKLADEDQKSVAAQPMGYYDPQSISDQHDFISGAKGSLADISKNGYQLPRIQRTYDMQAAIDKLPTSKIETQGLPDKNGVQQDLTLPNSTAHARTAANYVNNTPEAQAMISKQAGIPFNQIGNETDQKVIRQQMDDHWRSRPNVSTLAAAGITSYDDPQYQAMLDANSAKVANAAKIKQNTINVTKQQLDDKIGEVNRKKYDFAYNREMRDREIRGEGRMRFSDWLQTRQNESGQLTLGNQDSYVPVQKKWVNPGKMVDKEGNPLPAPIDPEKGASLYGVNLPDVETIVRPSQLTDTRTGKTIKNTDPLSVKVSQIQMVPVFTGLPGDDPRNGSEISLRQFREMAAGTNKTGGIKNITFQPFAYGLQSKKTADGVHTQSVPVKFSYDALKRSGDKKINTTKFDQTTQQLNEALQSPDFKALTPQERVEWFTKNFNWKD